MSEARAALRRWQRWLTAPVRHPIPTALVFGAVCRICLYLNGWYFWLDELSLLESLDRPVSKLFAPFARSQLAPPGWFAAEWGVSRLIGSTAYALHLISLFAGLAGFAAFVPVARRVVRPGAAWVAVALFAVSGDLIAYTSEFKPYICDVAVAVGIWLGTLTLLRTEHPSPRAWLASGLLGALVVWVSFPAVIVLAGAGTTLLLAALRAGRAGRAALPWVVGVGLVWLLSFAFEHRIATAMLGPTGRDNMQAFWDFAFPPWPPDSLRELLWPVRALLHVFLNPLDFFRPESFDPRLTLLPGALFFALGVASLRRRDASLLVLLIAPIALTGVVAYPRLYPFHGRLILFLAPAFFLLIAEGVGVALAVSRRYRSLRVLIVASVLLMPALHALHMVVDPHVEPLHNGLGDLRPYWLTPLRYPF